MTKEFSESQIQELQLALKDNPNCQIKLDYLYCSEKLDTVFDSLVIF